MIRGFLVLAGLVMAATGLTPFDLTGVHFSSDPFHEFAVCVLVLVAALCAATD